MGKLHILSHQYEAFTDRIEAGRLLAYELTGLEGEDAVVLGILRGGVIVAREIALSLGSELDIVLSRKIGAPTNPELAVGAVSEDGKLFINKALALYTGASDVYIQQEMKRQTAEISRRIKLFRKVQPKVSLNGKVTILADDGVATGATMQAALWAAHQENPTRVIVALPVGPEETLSKLAENSDELICLRAPADFAAVGQFYIRFEQVGDEDVLAILKDYRKKEAANE